MYILSLLEKFVGGECLVRLISEQSLGDSKTTTGTFVLAAAPSVVLDHTLVQLGSLPDIVSNKLGAYHDR